MKTFFESSHRHYEVILEQQYRLVKEARFGNYDAVQTMPYAEFLYFVKLLADDQQREQREIDKMSKGNK